MVSRLSFYFILIMKHSYFKHIFLLLGLCPLMAWADEWQDPETKVIYTYTQGGTEASVKAGSWSKAGSPDATGDISIISEITIDGTSYPVTKIGSYAFYKCKSLTTLTIPEGITSIGTSAFEGCSRLTSIIISEGVTSIGSSAFSGCYYLAEVTIPQSLTSIGQSAFYGCLALEEVVIPKNVSYIGKDAFRYCYHLTSLSVAQENSVYDSRNNCNAIIKTETNELVTGCQKTIIPDGVITIGNNAFYGITLTEINIPNSVTTIGMHAFSGCQRLTELFIPSSVSKIDIPTFEGCSSLLKITVEQGNAVYDSREDCNAIIQTETNELITGCQNTIIPNTVTSIGNYAFWESRNLKELLIPNSVTSIGSYAFNTCSELKTISIPSNVTNIGSAAFQSCTNLSEISIPQSVTSIGGYAFESCTKLKSVTVEWQTPIEIEGNVFSNRTNASLYVPEGTKEAYLPADYWKEFKDIVEINPSVIFFADTEVRRICIASWDTDGDGELSYEEAAAVQDLGDVFQYSQIESFDELQYFTGLTSIGQNCFYNCYKLSSIIIPDGVTSIGERAFYKCVSLQTINIPASVSVIGSYAFEGWRNLKEVVIPSSVVSIGVNPFINCNQLQTIVVDRNNLVYDSRENCNAIIETETNKLITGCQNTVISSGIITIGNNAFCGFSNIQSVNIPNSVTTIESYAFQNCI